MQAKVAKKERIPVIYAGMKTTNTATKPKEKGPRPNAKCPCGSKIKFKKCCDPKNKPE
jgi:uncharacterized protein YecA (UPF0149 family)